MDTITASISSMMNQYPSRWPAPLGHAKAAVADLPARWTHPFLVSERLHQPFTVAVLQTRCTELTPHSPTVLVVADGLGINGLLTALMTRCPIDLVIDFVRASFDDFDVACCRVGR